MASRRARPQMPPMAMLPVERDVEQDIDVALGARTFLTTPFFAASTVAANKRLLGKLPPLGAWCASPEVAALRAALDDALRGGEAKPPSSLCGGYALDLLTFPHDPPVPVGVPLRVRARVGVIVGDADDAPADDEWAECDDTCPPAALVLQHRFALHDSTCDEGAHSRALDAAHAAVHAAADGCGRY